MGGADAAAVVVEPEPSRGAFVRAAPWLHGIALILLVVEVVYWGVQPCVGDFLCAPVLGYVLGLAAIPFVLGLVLWRATGWLALIVAVDAVVGLVGPQLVTLPLRAVGSDLSVIPLAAIPWLLLGGVIGLLPALAVHRIERWIAGAALVVMGVWFVASGQPANAVVPAVIALAIAAHVSGALGERQSD